MKSSRKKNYRDRREALHQVVARLKLTEKEQQQRLQEQQLRAEVLADLCQVLDSIAVLRRSYSDIQTGAGKGDLAAEQQVSGQPTGISPQGSPVRKEKGQHRTSSISSLPQSSAHLMWSVPSYCCSADLISKATPELVKLAVSMTAAHRHVLRAGSASGIFKQNPPPQTSPAAPASTAEAAAQTQSSAALKAAAGAGVHALMQELEALVDGFYAILILVMVLHPIPLVQAMCLNHRTHEQEAAPSAHWMGVVQRLKLTSMQAAYMVAAQQEIMHIRRGNIRQISMLAQEAASPSLLVLAAQNQQQPVQPQRQSQPQPQQQSSPGLSSGHCSSDSGSAPSGGVTAAAQLNPVRSSTGGSSSRVAAAVVDDKPFKEVQLTCQFHHLTTYGTLMAFVVLDALTPMQKAQWLVSSYPWVPGPVVLCTCAGQMLKQASEQQAAGTTGDLYTAADGDPHMQAITARVQHLEQRRQQWQQQQLKQEQQQANMAASAHAMELVDALFGTAGVAPSPPCSA